MSQQPLEDKVKAWLERTGFPLEMETATVFQKAGFTVTQSSVYAHPESEKGREIDVVAHTRDATGLVQIYFAIECKASPNPWVVFETNEKQFAPAMDFFGVCSGLGRKAIASDFSDRRKLIPFVKAFDAGGYALRQAFSKEVDPAYAAVMTSIKACQAFSAAQVSATERLVSSMPVIIVDAPLLQCRQDAKGGLVLSEVDMSQFYFTALIPERTSSVVRIVNRRALPRFVNLCRGLSDSLKDAMKPKVEKWVASKRSKSADGK